MAYENVLQLCLEMQNVVYLESAFDEAIGTNMALDDLGLSTRATLRLIAAMELEKQKVQNEEKIDKESIKEDLRKIKEYRIDCELRKIFYYDAFKLKADEKDFHANVIWLTVVGLWSEIIEMLKRRELLDEFESKQEWIALGTEYRRLIEPLAVANFYNHGLNDDTGPYFGKGKSVTFKLTQKWREHKESLPAESITESCFWAEVEELTILSKKICYEDMKERITIMERQILQWHKAGVIENDVFLENSTLTEWWNSLPKQNKLESCIGGLFRK